MDKSLENFLNDGLFMDMSSLTSEEVDEELRGHGYDPLDLEEQVTLLQQEIALLEKENLEIEFAHNDIDIETFLDMEVASLNKYMQLYDLDPEEIENRAKGIIENKIVPISSSPQSADFKVDQPLSQAASVANMSCEAANGEPTEKKSGGGKVVPWKKRITELTIHLAVACSVAAIAITTVPSYITSKSDNYSNNQEMTLAGTANTTDIDISNFKTLNSNDFINHRQKDFVTINSFDNGFDNVAMTTMTDTNPSNAVFDSGNVSYTVKKGDSIWTIAKDHDVKPVDLSALASALENQELKPGDKVYKHKYDGHLNSFIIEKGEGDIVIAYRRSNDQGFYVEVRTLDLRRQRLKYSGALNGSIWKTIQENFPTGAERISSLIEDKLEISNANPYKLPINTKIDVAVDVYLDSMGRIKSLDKDSLKLSVTKGDTPFI